MTAFPIVRRSTLRRTVVLASFAGMVLLGSITMVSIAHGQGKGESADDAREFGPPDGGPGGNGPGGMQGVRGSAQPGQVLPESLQDELKLTAAQRRQLKELQETVDARLAKILNKTQWQQLQQMSQRGPGGSGFENGGPPDGSGPGVNVPRGGPGGDGFGGPPGGGPGGGGPGSGSGGSSPGGGPRSSPYTLSGAYTISSKTEKAEKQHYTSDKKDVSAVYVNQGGNLTLIDPTIATSGNSSSNENSSFYGLNAAVLVTKGSKATVSGGIVSTSGSGANGVFASGQGAEIALSNLTIKATGSGGHGVMATLGGLLTMKDVDITTSRERAGAIATDRGGGTIKATGGTVITYGSGSPGIYSTGDITVTGAKIDAVGAESAVIEGSNSITLDSTDITGRQRCGVMIYQSFSGDAQGRKGVFTMKGGSLTAKAGPIFYVNNTTAVITLRGVKLASDSGKLVDASAGRWGRSGSNGGNAILNVDGQTMDGNLTCDKISSITAALQNGSTLTGAVQGASLKLDLTSAWNVTADSVLADLTDEDGISGATIKNIHGNGHTVEYDASLPANKWLNNKTYDLSDGGRLTPKTSSAK